MSRHLIISLIRFPCILTVIICISLLVYIQSAIEAQYLANQVQLYYASKDSSRHELLEKFNLYPDKFDYTKVFELLQDGISHPATQH